MPLVLDQSLDFRDFLWKCRQDTIAGRGHKDVIFNADADLFFRNIDARLNGNHHIRLERPRCFSNVMYIKANVMARSMDEILVVTLRTNVAHSCLMNVADTG